MSDDQACENTDRELWREREGDFYADSIHVTVDGGIGMNVGGTVIVMPIFEWHALATGATRVVPFSPPEPTEGQITDAMVEEGAKVMASLCTAGIIETPQLPAPCWNGSVRAILEAALRAMPLQDHSEPKPPKMRAETTPEMWDLARRLVLEKPSTSYIQRKLMIGYNHACEIMEHFEAQGLVSASRADGTRVILAEQQTEAK